jgi:hypothetical protein
MSLPLHVNFHEGGQAIVGHVEHQGRVVNLATGFTAVDVGERLPGRVLDYRFLGDHSQSPRYAGRLSLEESDAQQCRSGMN